VIHTSEKNRTTTVSITSVNPEIKKSFAKYPPVLYPDIWIKIAARNIMATKANANIFMPFLFEIPKNIKNANPKTSKTNTPAGLIYGDMIFNKFIYLSPSHSSSPK
jgi:hypothetical protein